MSQRVQMRQEKTKLPVVIMAGGLGTRAKSIDASVPKPLIEIDGKPILLWEIECLTSQGYDDIILTVSYKAEQIQSYFGDGSSFGCGIQYFVESKPLGNAGALFKLSLPGQPLSEEAGVSDFLLLNADSMFDIDFDRFVSRHLKSGALVTLYVHKSDHVYDSGLLITDPDGWVEQWLTKEDQRPEYYHNCTNAGLHVISTSLLSELVKSRAIDPERIGKEDPDTGKIIKVDLDRQILKPLAGTHKMYAMEGSEYIKDMGTPERFEQVKMDLTSGLVHKRNLKEPQRAVFLDRDGTINRYVGFLRDIDQFELLPGVAEAIKLLNGAGYLAIIVTNQPVIARGEVSTAQLDNIHCKMETLLGYEGAYLDAIYICPHHPDRGFEGEVMSLKIDCDCRKPKPGLLFRAAKDFNIDLKSSWIIGDSWRDIAAGQAAGCKTILLTGEGTESYLSHSSYFSAEAKNEANRKAKNDNLRECSPDICTSNLLEAVRVVLDSTNSHVKNNQ